MPVKIAAAAFAALTLAAALASAVLGQPQTPLYVVFVWHHHQGINVWPNAVFHGAWAYIHVYKNEFSPYYEGGAYMVHAEILLKHPSVKMVYHLSPSLLWQWMYGLKHGYLNQDGSYVPPSDPKLKAVNETLSMYIELLKRGQIEVLTDFFNHPLAGYVAHTYKWGPQVIEEELKWGKAVTEHVLGVEAEGAWLPEMSFSMELVHILASQGIRYTVLDENHFNKAEGDKDTIYEPYILRADGGSQIVVFFRDTEISNQISFNNRYTSPEQAKQAAEKIVDMLLKIRETTPQAKVVVLAMDGENWMFTGPETAVFLDHLCSLLEREPRLKTATLKEVLENVQPTRVLTKIPLESWAGGHWVWTEKPENTKQWQLIDQAATLLQKIREKYGTNSTTYRSALFATFLTLNSDVIHREYTYPQHTETWALEVQLIYQKGEEEAEKMVSKGLNLYAEGRGPTTLAEAGPLNEQAPRQEIPPAAILAAAIAAIAAVAVLRKRRKSTPKTREE